MDEPPSRLWDSFCIELAKTGYTLERQLSKPQSRERNSSASVWLASFQPSEGSLEQHVLKISSEFAFPDDTTANPAEKRERLQARERIIYSKLSHDNIPAFKGVDHLAISGVDFNYFATQFIDSPTLLDRIYSDRPLDDKEAGVLLHDILSALNYVHTQKPRIFHRDVRPSNILFSGEKAYLFDFNFSVQEGSSRTTVVDNVGYYPADTYSGNQDPTQDLVALGNVIIAAGFAKEIFQVRDEQGVGSMDPLSLERLPFSPRLKSFLRKLTAVNPGLRYQSAQQALEEFAKLPDISEVALEQRVKTMLRDSRVDEMLKRLQKDDPLYAHNVPPSLLETYSDDRLLDHLRATYSRDEFVISDPAEILKYIKPNDKVVNRALINSGNVIIARDTECYVSSFSASGKPIISRFGYLDNREVAPEDLVVYGKRRWGRNYFSDALGDTFDAKNAANAIKVPVTSFQKKLNEKHIVAPLKDIYSHTWVIPAGAVGVVTSFDQYNKTFCIGWMDCEGLKGDQSFNLTWKPGYILLQKRNSINYEKLYQECFNGSA